MEPSLHLVNGWNWQDSDGDIPLRVVGMLNVMSSFGPRTIVGLSLRLGCYSSHGPCEDGGRERKWQNLSQIVAGARIILSILHMHAPSVCRRGRASSRRPS